MITFIIALLVLVGGYFLYGSYVERVFGPDKIRKTPALTMADGVDFIPLPTWKIFMIQFLNIAGLGPIFGAIGSEVWYGVLFVDCFRYHFCRGGTRLFVRNAFHSA